MKWLIALLLLLIVPGCELPKTDVALPVNFSVTWQIGIVIALAYLANSKNHLSAIASIALNMLRGLKILPPSDSKASLDAEDVAKRLAQLYIDLQGHPETQAGILKLMQPTDAAAAENESPPAKASRK